MCLESAAVLHGLPSFGECRDIHVFAAHRSASRRFGDVSVHTSVDPREVVEIAGVRVGRVASISLDQTRDMALVSLHVNNGVELYDDALASVRTSGLIGDKYILLSPGGSGEPLKDGDEVSDTESALDLESMIGKFIFGKV